MSGKNETCLLTYNAELGIFATRFRDALSLGLPKRNLVLQAEEFVGPADSPTISNTGQFISHSGINYTPMGYPQTIAQCFEMIDGLLFQVCHKESSLSTKNSRRWTVNLLKFKAEVTILIQGLGVTDSPKSNHILHRAAACRYFYHKINQAAINEDSGLLVAGLNSDWRKLTDWATNGSVVKPDVLVAVLQLSGYRCEDTACGALASNNHFCSTCKLSTPMSEKLFPSSKQPASEANNTSYKKR